MLNQTANIIVHQSVDFDAVASAFLLSKLADIYGYSDKNYLFVAATTTADEIMYTHSRASKGEQAFIADTGKQHDGLYTFDHHQDGTNKTISATSLVLDALIKQDRGWADCRKLAALATSGDWMQNTNGADWSSSIGLHAILSGLKAQGATDATIIAVMFPLLDLVCSTLKNQAQALRDAKELIVAEGEVHIQGQIVKWCYTKPNAGLEVTKALYGLGYTIVASEDTITKDGAGLNPRRINRAPDSMIHLGKWIDEVIKYFERKSSYGNIGILEVELYQELKTWYKHQDGFMVGLSLIGGDCEYNTQITFEEVVKMLFQ
jgi:hypothetical protein